jgi:type II secretory pathway pseudopilin PulG
MRLLCRRAMTLTELLIALIMAVLMMLGIAAADFAMRRMDRTVSGDAQLYMRTLAMAEDIRQSARLATGDNEDQGIVVTGDTMCFRVDLNPPGTPDSYADDASRCYTRIGTNMYACTHTPAGSPFAAVACAVTDRWVGSVVSDVYTCGAGTPKVPCFYPVLFEDPVNSQYFFEFQIVSRTDPSVGANVIDVAGVKTFSNKDATNPQVVISSRISPESHSF